MRRDGDDWNLAENLFLTNLSCGGEPIELGQAEIHQDKCGAAFTGHFDRLFTIARLHHLVTSHFQQPSHHETTVLEVFYHQKKVVFGFHKLRKVKSASITADLAHH